MGKRECGDHDQSADGASSDEVEIEAFCSTIKFEEISFESWQDKHRKLDLTFPLRIKRSELDQTQRALVKLSRTITTTSTNGRRVEQRERFEFEVPICSNLKDSKVLKYPGLGDRCDSAAGDLLIILHIFD